MFKNILHWLAARAKEKSTYFGLATIAASLGFPAAVPYLNTAGAIAGALLTAATTTPAAPADASLAG